MWMEIDNMIRKLKEVIKERSTVKQALTEKILRFMATYNIEDLKTQEGKLRYTVTKAKKAPSKAEIRERITENYGKVSNLDELVEKIFAKEERAERAALRRVNARKTVEL
jgi:RecA/RadA recombinase